MLLARRPIMREPRRQSPRGSLAFGYELSDPLGLSGPPEVDFMNNPPPPPPGNPILTDAETTRVKSHMAQMTSLSNEYDDQNFGEGFNTGDCFHIPALMGISSGYGVVGQYPNNSYFEASFQAPMEYSFTNMAPSSGPIASTAPGNLIEPLPVTAGSQDFAMANVYSYAPPTALASVAGPMQPTTPTFAHRSRMAHESQPSPTMQQLSPGVLEAATVLQGGPHHRSHSMHNISQQRPLNQGMGPPVGHLRHQDMSDFRQERRRMSESLNPPQTETFAEWAFGGDRDFVNAPRQHRGPAPVNLQYGSDVRFNGNQPFMPQNDKESFEGMTQEQERYMAAVKLSDSAESTRQPTPDFVISGLNLRTKGPPNSLRMPTIVTDGPQAPCPEEEPQSATSKSTGRKRKTNRSASTEPPSAESNNGSKKKRRKSGGAAKKENLTDAQKRANHIASEKKRRKVIEIGFNNLNKMKQRGATPSSKLCSDAQKRENHLSSERKRRKVIEIGFNNLNKMV